jgi:redox-sensitive bicupin YhaK (pirin superfamily)
MPEDYVNARQGFWSSEWTRRQFLAGLGSLGAAVGAGLWPRTSWAARETKGEWPVIKSEFDLDFQWPVQEPFVFCVHHHDNYPRGMPNMGPDPKHSKGRRIGQDFVLKDGFRMYHGETIPGFPVHPHRGFETVTLVRKGYVDHSDSMGAAGRYGQGDMQWMTAGSGIQHSEMFPLLRRDGDNTLELFQIWLNLPAKNKMVKPHFSMFWSEKIPQVSLDENRAHVNLIAGTWGDTTALAPPPDSWASRPESEIGIWLIRMLPGGRVSLPTTQASASRMVYFFQGEGLLLNGKKVEVSKGLALDSRRQTELSAGKSTVEVLVLQARPIGEPVVQHGPFVMNSRAEIAQAFEDYQNTQFGGWPWPEREMVHGSALERFAKYPDGRIENPTTSG